MGIFKFGGRKLDAARVETLIGSEALVQGVLNLRGSLRVDGRVEGSITEAETVVIAAGGMVHGDISAETVVIGGRVTGNITASEEVEILSNGEVLGDLRTPRLVVEEGAKLDGRCSMNGTESSEEPTEAVTAKK